MRISNLSDVKVPRWVIGDPDIVNDVLVCVYIERTHGNNDHYNITATGDGPGFFLRNGSFIIPYTVTWNDGGDRNPSGGTTATLVSNVELANRKKARTARDQPSSSSDCVGGNEPTARLRITISKTAMDKARDGTFNGTLTLFVTPK